MKKILLLMTLTILIVAGCGANKMNFTVDKAPIYQNEVTSEFIVKVTESGEGVSGLTLTASLEMVKMDHGSIDVSFVDNGDGTYTGDAELSMAGEWIADIRADKDGKVVEDVLTFDVKER